MSGVPRGLPFWEHHVVRPVSRSEDSGSPSLFRLCGPDGWTEAGLWLTDSFSTVPQRRPAANTPSDVVVMSAHMTAIEYSPLHRAGAAAVMSITARDDGRTT